MPRRNNSSKNTTATTNYDGGLVFSVIEDAIGIPMELVDRALISWVEDHEGFSLAIPTDLNVLKSLTYFKKNKHNLHFVQLGEYLSFEHLEVDKPFVAYTKDYIGACPMTGRLLREVFAYSPTYSPGIA